VALLAGTAVVHRYNYAIYAFSVHFGPLFLVWVAVLGLALFALIGGLTALRTSFEVPSLLTVPAAGAAAVHVAPCHPGASRW
jgi:hypothetical protein